MCEYLYDCGKLPWMIDFFSTDCGRIPNYQLKAAYASNKLKHDIKLNIESRTPVKRLVRIMCSIAEVHTCKEYGDMMEAGMNIALIKATLHATNEWRDIVKYLRYACDVHSRKIGRVYPLGIALELRGTEIRTGKIKYTIREREIKLEKGNRVSLTIDPTYEEHVTNEIVYVDFPRLTDVVKPGDNIYLNNSINLSALDIVGSVINCIIETAGNIASHASVTMPSVPIEIPVIPERDQEDILAAINDKINFFVIPGLQTNYHINKYKEAFGEQGKSILILSKIDTNIAVTNIDDIIKFSDGILIDRGTLALEIPQEKLFLIQKSIIAKCNLAGKPVICGPNMLKSMINSKRPLNSEILDVSNAVLDGIDCLQLSKELMRKPHRIDALKALNAICKEAEAATYQKQIFNDFISNTKTPIEVVYSIAIATVETALKCQAAAIIVLTVSGKSAKIISRFKPRCPIIAITSHLDVAKQLQVYRGLDPIYYIKSRAKSWQVDADRRIQLGVTYGKISGFIRAGDAIVITSGTRPSSGFTNLLKVVYASDFDTVPNECICYS